MSVACCHDCGLAYGSPAWADVVIPHTIWSRISPSHDENGLLCFNCMNKRLTLLGLVNVPFHVGSGAFAFDAKAGQIDSPFTPRPTILTVAVEILRDAKVPLSATEIASRAIARGWGAESIEQARSKVAAIVSKNKRSEKPLFEHVGRGRISLTEWFDAASPSPLEAASKEAP